MPRSYKSTEVFLKGDPRYNNKLASKIINKIMLQGKKTTAVEETGITDVSKLMGEFV